MPRHSISAGGDTAEQTHHDSGEIQKFSEGAARDKAMGQYIFSSELRRAAGRIFDEALASLRVVVVGERPLETMLFRNIASSVEHFGPDAAASLGRYDFALCGIEDLAALEEGLSGCDDTGRETGAIKGIAVRGPLGRVSSRTWRLVESLHIRLGLTLAAQWTEIVDFGQDKEVVFILVRDSDASRDPFALLKVAIFLEAHSLFDGAAQLLTRYNATMADAAQAIDVDIIDRVYEVRSFTGHSAADTGVTTQPEEDEGSAAELAPRRLLSVHFDRMHRGDGEARLRHLAHSLALPEQVEIVVRIAASQPPPYWLAVVAELAELGVTVKSFNDPIKPGEVDPGSSGFLDATAPEALVAVYYGEIEPDVPGWDFDLLRVAKTATATMFALRVSGHKTRNYVSRKDAENAAEGLPSVSRAWLEACGAWSVAGVAPGIFQTLVAFYYDRTDWTNKHRSLNLHPVMTLSSRPMKTETEAGSPDRSRREVSYRARRRAIEAALRIHALEWGAGQGIDEPALECDPIRRRLVMRGPGPARRKIIRSWTLPRDHVRLPL